MKKVEATVLVEADGLEVSVSVSGDETWAAGAVLDRARRAADEALNPIVHSSSVSRQ